MSRPWDLGFYHSGAGDDDLGGAIGSRIDNADMISWTSLVNVTGVTIIDAASFHALDLDENPLGVLAYENASGSLKWQPPGEAVFGSLVDVGAGGLNYLYGPYDDSQYLAVEVQAGSLPGSDQQDNVNFSYISNVIFDDVTSQESETGDIEYKGFFIKNESGDFLTGLQVYADVSYVDSGALVSGYGSSGSVEVDMGSYLADFPASGFMYNSERSEALYYASKSIDGTKALVSSAGRGVRGTAAAAGLAGDGINYYAPIDLGFEEPSGGSIQTIANESTAPSGVSFNYHGLSSVKLLGGLGPLEMWGVWLKRFVQVNSRPLVGQRGSLRFVFDN